MASGNSQIVLPKTALISVAKKAGSVEFARFLAERGTRIISTGGTAQAIREAGIEVLDVSDHTGFPEMFDGRVKTLHPKVHGGLLYRRGVKEDLEDAALHGINAIDLLVVNFYDFAAEIAKGNVTREQAVEKIDVGGPAMVRAAAKNYVDVAVVPSFALYEAMMREIAEYGGTSLETREQLMVQVFKITSDYDNQIYRYFAHEFGFTGM